MRRNIKLRVKNLVKKYNTTDPYKICQKLGIIVLYEDLGIVKGFCKSTMGMKIIMINSVFSAFAQKIILAHELGHAILHSDYDTAFMKDHFLSFSDILENEANKFAAELLINAYDNDNIEYCDYYCDEVSTDEFDRELLNRLREFRFSNKYLNI